MQIEKIQFDNVRYNPERCAFETLVRVHGSGRSFSYPVHVAAPLHAEFGIVARGLSQAARNAHRAASRGMRMEHDVAPLQDTTPETPLLDRLMGQSAA